MVFLLWSTPLTMPLKLLIVFLHELSHVVAVVLTGGTVETLAVDPSQGGHVIARGGSRFLSLSAGYLGSLLIGLFLFFVALRSNADRMAMGTLGAGLILVSLIYGRDAFTLIFGLAMGAAMLSAAAYGSRRFNDFILRIIGLSSMIYVPYDIYSDTIARSELRSDARMLSEEFGGPTLFWGGLWLLISLYVIYIAFRRGLGEDSNLIVRGASPDDDQLS